MACQRRLISAAMVCLVVTACSAGSTDSSDTTAIATANEQHVFGRADVVAANQDFADAYLPDEADHPELGPEHDGGPPTTMTQSGPEIRMSASINETTNQLDLYVEPESLDEAEAFASRYPAGLVKIIMVDPGTLTPVEE